MSCSLNRNGHKHSPYDRIYIEIFHFVSRFATVSLSHIRENFLKMWNVNSGHMEIVWPCCANTVDVWVSRRYEFFPSFSAATSLLVLLSISASFCHTWELDAASFWFGSLATSFSVLFQSCLTGCPECLRTLRCHWTLQSKNLSQLARQVQRRFLRDKFNVGFLTLQQLSCPFSSCILFCRTTSHEKLCGSWTRVSLLDFSFDDHFNHCFVRLWSSGSWSAHGRHPSAPRGDHLSTRSERQRRSSATFNGPIGFPQTRFQCPRSRRATLELGHAFRFSKSLPRPDPVDSDPGATFWWSPPYIEQELAEALDVSPTWEPPVLSKMSVPHRLLNFDSFHQPCLFPGRIPGQERTVIPVSRGDHLLLRTARSSLRASYWRYIPLRLDGTQQDDNSPIFPVCATPTRRVLAHTQVRDPRESAAACWAQAMGTPSPWPSSKMWSIAPNWEEFAFDETYSTLLKSRLSRWIGVLVWLWVCLFDGVSRDRFPCIFPFGFL